MRLQLLASALALFGSSAAFSDSSPWVVLSTSSFDQNNASNIQTSAQIVEATKKALQSCPTDRYLLVNQPGISALDLQASKDCHMPHLCHAVEDKSISGKLMASEVVGDVKHTGLEDFIKEACAKKTGISVEAIELSSPAKNDRAGSLAQSGMMRPNRGYLKLGADPFIDAAFAAKLEDLKNDKSYTVIFYSSAVEPVYEADFADPAHLELRRNVESPVLRREKKTSGRDNRNLFEKYQFFTPGIFMGLIVVIFLFAILYVGVSALGSLEVSYGAFEKDVSPASQKKQQ
ncbi:unnamed protein product [Clonostachys rosea f. rosea IK726]|uniref:Protein BIG1 n=2 Tax=Bionectria ochroleuca TaxID=29856 RepID=A0A0B7JRK6_BIOOC|nr:unnamed protein product [Clonostachys rosea f. rosea IK726]